MLTLEETSSWSSRGWVSASSLSWSLLDLYELGRESCFELACCLRTFRRRFLFSLDSLTLRYDALMPATYKFTILNDTKNTNDKKYSRAHGWSVSCAHHITWLQLSRVTILKHVRNATAKLLKHVMPKSGHDGTRSTASAHGRGDAPASLQPGSPVSGSRKAHGLGSTLRLV